MRLSCRRLFGCTRRLFDERLDHLAPVALDTVCLVQTGRLRLSADHAFTVDPNHLGHDETIEGRNAHELEDLGPVGPADRVADVEVLHEIVHDARCSRVRGEKLVIKGYADWLKPARAVLLVQAREYSRSVLAMRARCEQAFHNHDLAAQAAQV